MQHHQTLSYHQHNTQAQPPHASTYHSAFSYATTGLPVTPTEFGSADDAAAAITAAGPAAGGLPSPPYVCSPQQNHTDLGAYAAGALETGVSSAATTTTFPLQIVNEQGFGHGRMPPARSASNGSTWSVGSGSRSIGGGSGNGGGGGAATANVERTHVTSGVSANSQFLIYFLSILEPCAVQQRKIPVNVGYSPRINGLLSFACRSSLEAAGIKF